MSKLNNKDKFLDLSDYGRGFGRFLANSLKNTSFTPIHVTLLFGISGLIAVYCILNGYNILAAFFIVLKSGIDAADGELARLKKTPSYSGRYLDSIFDIFLNFFLLSAIWYVTNYPFWIILIAFFCIQLQGTLYNYYYVILRTKSVGGDSTSKVFEQKTPKALPGELQKTVDILYGIYSIVYGYFDKIIYLLDPKAYKVKTFPNWFMTALSIYGLGFQLLVIAFLLSINQLKYSIPYFIISSIGILIFILIRKKSIK